MPTHPTHKTRYSDSSIYDEVCELCGATDGPGDKGLNYPCREAVKKGEVNMQDYIVYYCDNPMAEQMLMKAFGFERDKWEVAKVLYRSTVYGITGKAHTMQYHTMGNIVIAKSLEGTFWLDPFYGPEPMVACIGRRIKPGMEEKIEGAQLVQESYSLEINGRGPQEVGSYRKKVWKVGQVFFETCINLPLVK